MQQAARGRRRSPADQIVEQLRAADRFPTGDARRAAAQRRAARLAAADPAVLDHPSLAHVRSRLRQWALRSVPAERSRRSASRREQSRRRRAVSLLRSLEDSRPQRSQVPMWRCATWTRTRPAPGGPPMLLAHRATTIARRVAQCWHACCVPSRRRSERGRHWRHGSPSCRALRLRRLPTCALPPVPRAGWRSSGCNCGRRSSGASTAIVASVWKHHRRRWRSTRYRLRWHLVRLCRGWRRARNWPLRASDPEPTTRWSSRPMAASPQRLPTDRRRGSLMVAHEVGTHCTLESRSPEPPGALVGETVACWASLVTGTSLAVAAGMGHRRWPWRWATRWWRSCSSLARSARSRTAHLLVHNGSGVTARRSTRPGWRFIVSVGLRRRGSGPRRPVGSAAVAGDRPGPRSRTCGRRCSLWRSIGTPTMPMG
jgi:hypothetical protein